MLRYYFFEVLWTILNFVITTVKTYSYWVYGMVKATSNEATEKDTQLKQWVCTMKAIFLAMFFGLLIPLAIMYFVCLAVKHFIIWALALFVIILIIFDYLERKKAREAAERQAYIENTCYLVCLEVFTALHELGSLLPVKPLHTLIELTAEMIDRKDFLTVRVSALKTIDTALTDDERQRIKAQLQAVINNHLRAGLVVGANYASYDGKTPLLYVEQVLNNGIYITFDLIVADTAGAIAHIESITAPKNHTVADGADKDF